MPKTTNRSAFKKHDKFEALGLTPTGIAQACEYVHQTIETIDTALLRVGTDRLANLVELANLSSMIGNLFGAGIARFSGEVLKRNRPHTYPDLVYRATGKGAIEIKVALEGNMPKGHNAKAGYYLTCRYVLLEANEDFILPTERKKQGGERGSIPMIWEIRFGYLDLAHFNSSNTPGDSGKTATFNKVGMEQLDVVYCDLSIAPYTKSSRIYKALAKQFGPMAPPNLFDK